MKSGQTSNTMNEILRQPECWRRSLRTVAGFELSDIFYARKGESREWLYIGCGTSYYLAQAAAATYTALTGMRARAVPASEVYLCPELALRKGERFVPVLISRSGRTSEVLRAAEYLKQLGVSSLAITCDGNELKQVADCTIQLPVHELSTVMTSSFTSMLLALQYLSATLAGNFSFVQSLESLPEAMDGLLKSQAGKIQNFVQQHSFEDYVYLGQGAFVGIAAEAALKVMESSCSYAQSFHTMEFRHGPKSIVSPKTMIGFFLSSNSYEDELSVLQEMHDLGGIIFAVTNQADTRLTSHAHCLIEMGLAGPSLSHLAPAVVWGQLLGVLSGIKRGLNPDSPKNLTRSVVLGE